MSRYLVIIFRDNLMMSHRRADSWQEVKELRDMAIRTNARRVCVQKLRLRLTTDLETFLSGFEIEYTTYPHTIWRLATAKSC